MFSFIASQFADKLMRCRTEVELASVRQHIQKYFDQNPEFKKEWKGWLSDIRDSVLLEIKTPEMPDSEFLKKEEL